MGSGRIISGPVLIAITIIRMVLVPLFVLIVIQKGIHSDVVSLILTIVLGYTNGVCSINGMRNGPNMIRIKKEQEYAGYLMTVCLMIGITSGLSLALPIKHSIIG